MDARINSYGPATIASTQRVQVKKDKVESNEIKAKKVVETKGEERQQRIDTYAAYRKRKYAERIKTRFDLFL